MSYVTTFSQAVSIDSTNGSVLPLNAGASFVGVAKTTLGVVGIQVSLKTDQNSHVYIDQSPGLLAGFGTSVQTNGTGLIGTGTKFLRDFRVGDQIWVGAQTVRVIDSISSDTALTVSVAFDANASGLSFTQYYWDISDEFDYIDRTNNFGVTVQAISSFLRVRVTNVSSVNQTYLRLQTALCPIVEAIPRSLDLDGNLRVGVKSIVDSYGFETENTPMGEMRVVEPFRLVGSTFDGNTIDTNFWTASASGTGASIAQSNAQILITSGTGNGASVSLISVRRGRYVGGAGMRYRAVLNVSAGTANNRRRWGIGYGATLPTITDGAYFQWDGTSFGITTLKGTTPTTVSSGSFNGVLGSTWQPGTGVYTYEIYWTNSKVYFVVGGDVLHTVSVSASSWASTMSHYVFADSLNSNTATSVTLSIRTSTIYRLGRDHTSSITKHIITATNLLLKNGAGNLHRVVFNRFENGAVVTIGDNVSSAATNTLAIINPPNGVLPGTLEYSADFYNGLIITITGTVDLTVVYE